MDLFLGCSLISAAHQTMLVVCALFCIASTDHLLVGIDAAERGDLDAAIISFRKAAKNDDSTEAWYNLGSALAEQAEAVENEEEELLAEAKVCLEKSLAKDPHNQDARDELQRMSSVCEDDDKALQRNTMQDFMRCVDAAMFGACEEVLVPGAESEEDTFNARSECPRSCGLCDDGASAMKVEEPEKQAQSLEGAKIAGFYHIGTFGQYARIVDEQLKTLVDSGLYAAAEEIVVGVVGDGSDDWQPPSKLTKIRVGARDSDPKAYEVPTLGKLHSYCQANRDALVFYVHTKGASSMGITDARVAIPQAVEDWRRLMEYFVLERHADCVDALLRGGSSACGVNYMPGPPHFSGNFWWAKCECVAELPPLQAVSAATGERLLAEQWLLQQGGACLGRGKVRNMWYSGLYWNVQGKGHYVTRYPRERYAGMRCRHEACTDPPIPGTNW